MNPKFNGSLSAYPNELAGSQPGLTKRELFAALAMQGINTLEDQRTCPRERMGEIELWRQELAREDARHCIRQADALLAELEKPQP